jgi:hypothetical protein
MITLKTISDLCRRLNEFGVKYVVVGGCAILLHGYERTTRDIDMLVDVSFDNINKIKKAIAGFLPEAAAELNENDVEQNTVVRMVGEDVIVDLMGHIGETDFKLASDDVDQVDINGVMVPIAGLDTMLKLKEGVREIDKRDYLFLKGKKEYLEKK